MSAVPVRPVAVERPPLLAVEVEHLARSTSDEVAAALVRQLCRLLAVVPVIRLIDLFDRWASKLESLGLTHEGGDLRIRHRVSRGKHLELRLLTDERIG